VMRHQAEGLVVGVGGEGGTRRLAVLLADDVLAVLAEDAGTSPMSTSTSFLVNTPGRKR
jgi:hypothetical protein